MDRLFLDANVSFSAAYRPGTELLQLWKLENVDLCSSDYALEEASINLVEAGQRMRLVEFSGMIELFEALCGNFRLESRCRKRISRSYSLQSKREPLIC
jgi:predicted nucleic acid-binding protein